MSQRIATIAKIINLDRRIFQRKLGMIRAVKSSTKVSPKPSYFVRLRRYTLTTLEPRVLAVAVLAGLLAFSSSSVAQTSARSAGIRDIATLSLTSPLLVALGSWPPWDGWGWDKPSAPKPPNPKKPPVGVPEGGSEAMYLSFGGLACLTALIWQQRQTSH